MNIRNYKPEDYESVKEIYEQTGWFDEVTDSEEGLRNKISKDPDSILVAEDDSGITGTVSIIHDGRYALLFRLLAREDTDGKVVRNALMDAAEEILRERGQKRVHITSIEDDNELHDEYENNGYNKGRKYQWFWKEI